MNEHTEIVSIDSAKNSRWKCDYEHVCLRCHSGTFEFTLILCLAYINSSTAALVCHFCKWFALALTLRTTYDFNQLKWIIKNFWHFEIRRSESETELIGVKHSDNFWELNAFLRFRVFVFITTNHNYNWFYLWC